jgi:nitrogen fixation protein FixH
MAATVGTRSWIPWIFVAAMGVVVAVNGVMVYLALSSFGGLAHERAFARGIAYNRLLATIEHQESLGWRATLRWEPAASGNGAGELRLDLAQANTAPLSGASIQARLRRPLERMAVVDAQFVETSGGIYVARLALPRAGQWDVELQVTRLAESLDLRQRIFAR